MNKPVILFFLLCCCCTTQLRAQPFLLTSARTKPSFSLKIYYGTEGKGAFVQYSGQKGIILSSSKVTAAIV